MVPYDKPTEMLSLFRQFIDMYDNNAQTSKLLKIRNSPCVFTLLIFHKKNTS
jgi:hypothetical protein